MPIHDDGYVIQEKHAERWHTLWPSARSAKEDAIKDWEDYYYQERAEGVTFKDANREGWVRVRLVRSPGTSD